MDMATYCYNKKMTYEQYQTFKDNIQKAAEAIVKLIKAMYKTDTGMYHPTQEIIANIPGKTDENIKAFIIQGLKQLGVEFIENNSYWRY